MLPNFLLLWQNNPRQTTYKEERFILVHGFRGFGLWSLGLVSLGPWWGGTTRQECVVDEACLSHGLWEAQREEEKEGREREEKRGGGEEEERKQEKEEEKEGEEERDIGRDRDRNRHPDPDPISPSRSSSQSPNFLPPGPTS
jgi:hypothetical protein